MINKEQKRELASKIHSSYVSNNWFFMIGYSGLKASDTITMRSQLRKSASKMSAIKNRINLIAAKGTGLEVISNKISGKVAIVYGTDPVATAKVIRGYASQNKISVICFTDSDKVYDVSFLSTVSELPSIDILRANLIAQLTRPMSNFISLIKEPSSSMVRIIKAKENK